MDPSDYKGREQSFIKHYVLRNYLQALAFKVGQFRKGTTLNYIDGFSGPWKAATEDLRDTSPALAMSVLSAAARDLAARGVPFRVRCMFVESDPSAFEQLAPLCATFQAIESERFPGELEGHIPDAVAFATTGPNAFAFVFVDPTGWTGLGLHAITPLLQVTPGEVLINFMTAHVIRHIDDPRPEIAAAFEDLFGQAAPSFRARWRGLEGIDREDAIVDAYCERIRLAGGFKYCARTVIVNPLSDRTHFDLVYATRSRKGLVAFRETERKAIEQQIEVRASAKQGARTERTGQGELFGGAASDTPYIRDLQARYAARAKDAVLGALTGGGEVAYEDLVDVALAHPLVAERDLKDWIDEWRKARKLDVLGLEPGARRVMLDKGHRVRRR